MNNYAICLKLGIALYYSVSSAFGRDTCNYFTGQYCPDGHYCCDDYEGTWCCPDSDKYKLGTAAIAGIVIGSIIFIAVVAGLCAVCIFGVGKHRGSSGNVINPNTGAQMQVIPTGYMYVQPGGSRVVYPPGQAPPYGQLGGSGAVYPPGQPPAYGQPPTGVYPPPPPVNSSEKARQSGV